MEIDGKDAGYVTAAKLTYDVLGPTAKILGKQLGEWTGAALKNGERVLTWAFKRLGNLIPVDRGVPSRIAKTIVMEAPFCEDELAAAYFGGVLASSWSGIDRDDRGQTYLMQLTRMSTYQVRAHYVFYQVATKLLEGKLKSLRDNESLFGQSIGIPEASFKGAMGFSLNEEKKMGVLVYHAMTGLEREGLISSNWALGGYKTSNLAVSSSTRAWLSFEATRPGIELLAWAYGKCDLGWVECFDGGHFQPVPGIEVPTDGEWLDRNIWSLTGR